MRNSWGEVYGRPDLMLGPGGPAASGNPSIAPGCLGCGTPFDPLLRTSKYEEYRDLRNGFFIRKLDVTFDNVLGHHNYVACSRRRRSIVTRAISQHSASTEVQIPISLRRNTSRLHQHDPDALFHDLAGSLEISGSNPIQLQASPSTNLPSLVAGTGINAQQGVVTNFNFITPSILARQERSLAPTTSLQIST